MNCARRKQSSFTLFASIQRGKEFIDALSRSLLLAVGHCFWFCESEQQQQHRHIHTIDPRAHTYGPTEIERLINTLLFFFLFLFWIDSNFSSTAHLNHLTSFSILFVPSPLSSFSSFVFSLLGLVYNTS